jgi:hypothetical protein
MMGADLTATIVTAVNVLIAAASALYTRQQALPLKTKRGVCQNLLRLRGALKDIGHTGRAIGRLMREETFERGNPDLDKLILFLEEQNRNLMRATSEFKSLAVIFDIHTDDLPELIIHLRGKSDRIELIYSVASGTDIRKHLKRSVRGWEDSKILKQPEELIRVVSRTGPGQKVGPAEITRERDENFDQILRCIPKLNRFIREHCPVEYLA